MDEKNRNPAGQPAPESPSTGLKREFSAAETLDEPTDTDRDASTAPSFLPTRPRSSTPSSKRLRLPAEGPSQPGLQQHQSQQVQPPPRPPDSVTPPQRKDQRPACVLPRLRAFENELAALESGFGSELSSGVQTSSYPSRAQAPLSPGPAGAPCPPPAAHHSSRASVVETGHSSNAPLPPAFSRSTTNCLSSQPEAVPKSRQGDSPVTSSVVPSSPKPPMGAFLPPAAGSYRLQRPPQASQVLNSEPPSSHPRPSIDGLGQPRPTHRADQPRRVRPNARPWGQSRSTSSGPVQPSHGSTVRSRSHSAPEPLRLTSSPPRSPRTCGRPLGPGVPWGSPRESSGPEPPEDDEFACHPCKRTFGRLSDLRRHNTRVHAEKCFCCPYCNKPFPAESSVDRHKKKCTRKPSSGTQGDGDHRRESSGDSGSRLGGQEPAAAAPTQTAAQSRATFRCHLCDHGDFFRSQDLKRHITITHAPWRNEQCRCPYCEWYLPDEKTLGFHKTVCSKRPSDEKGGENDGEVESSGGCK